VELAALETKSLLASAQCSEVLTSLWNNITTELHDDPSGWLTADIDVEEAPTGHLAGDSGQTTNESEAEELNLVAGCSAGCRKN